MTKPRKHEALTKRQKVILQAQTPTARASGTIEDRAAKLDIVKGTFHSTNTQIFYKLVNALEVLTDPDNYDTFKGRFKKNEDHIWTMSRQLRTIIKRAIE